MKIRKLSINDIELLVKLRIDFLCDEGIELPKQELDDITQKCRDYFHHAYETDSFVAFVAEDGEELMSCAFMSTGYRPPRRAFAPYSVGTIYNVLTYKKYRKRGLATKVLNALMDEAKLMGIHTVDLWATKDGEKLYENLGFWSINVTPMRKEL